MKRASRALRTTAIWTSFLSLSAHALAEDSPTQKLQAANADGNSRPSPGETSGAAPGETTPERAAAAAYQEAVASYAKGDLTAALSSMRASYRLSNRAELLYNLACLEEELKACRDALADYRRYLALVPHGHYRESAERASARLDLQCPKAPAPAANAAPSPKPGPKPKPAEGPPLKREQKSYWSAPRIVGWSAIAAGTVAGASALYFQLQAIHAKREFQSSVDNATQGAPIDTSLQDQQHRYNHAAIGLGITASAMVATGVVVLLLAPGKRDPRARGASFYALPGLIGASYAQRF